MVVTIIVKNKKSLQLDRSNWVMSDRSNGRTSNT